ncbi:hypothetical protein JCM10450v2_003405 [Rhodotorula kratochvilovae]
MRPYIGQIFSSKQVLQDWHSDIGSTFYAAPCLGKEHLSVVCPLRRSGSCTFSCSVRLHKKDNLFHIPKGSILEHDDAAFGKSWQRHVLLVCASYDAQKHVVTLVYGFVVTENNDSWNQFIGHLTYAFPTVNAPGMVVFSDRHQALLAAIIGKLFRASSSFCTNHLRRNFENHLQTKQYTSNLNQLVYVCTEADFLAVLNSLSLLGPGGLAVVEYIKTLPPARWATYAFPSSH